MRTRISHHWASRSVVGCVLLAVVLAACGPGPQPGPPAGPTVRLFRPPPAASTTLGANLKGVPGLTALPFEENHGQAPADITYLLRAGALQVGLGAADVRY